MLCSRCLRAVARRHSTLARSVSATPRFYSTEPKLSTPTGEVGDARQPAASTPPRSICPEGTVLNGLNYMKGGQDPVAMPDDAYPEWLWSCLSVMKKGADEADADMGDEFSKSKKQRKLAAKRQKAAQDKLIAEGNLEALAPKIPLQHQSVNLSGKEDSDTLENIVAAKEREALRKAMRKERKAKIKEANYLKSM